MKVWITKYALSTGIHEMEATLCKEGDGSMIEVRGQCTTHYHGKEWHRTKEAADARVLEMIVAKRKSVAKQLAKLDELAAKINKHAPAPKTLRGEKMPAAGFSHYLITLPPTCPALVMKRGVPVAVTVDIGGEDEPASVRAMFCEPAADAVQKIADATRAEHTEGEPSVLDIRVQGWTCQAVIGLPPSTSFGIAT